MSIDIRDKHEGSVYSVSMYENEAVIGQIEAISDGEEWARITSLKTDKGVPGRRIEDGLIEIMKDMLKGQHIFADIEWEHFQVFEELGFVRSKTSFTYVNDLPEAAVKELEKKNLLLPEGFRFENEFYKDRPFIDNGKYVKVKNAGRINYSDSIEGINFSDVNEVLSRAFGGHERDREKTEKVFRNSENTEFAFDGNKLVGVSRMVTDKKENGLILNVAVDPSYQGYHIGWNLVVKLAAQQKGYSIFLNTHPGAVGFYNRPGFRRNKTAFYYSEREMPPELAQKFNLPTGYRFPDEYPL